MTPEERLKNLKNVDRWTVNSIEARADVVPTRTRPTRFIIPAVAGLVAVAVAGALVVGAVTLRSNRADPAITTPTSSSPTPTPTATATAAPGATTGYAPPNQPFAGDCTAVTSIQAMSDAVGATVSAGDSLSLGSPSGKDPVDGYIGTAITPTWSFAARESGGLTCAWAAKPQIAVDVTVFPADAVAAQTDESCGTLPPTDGDQHATDCAVNVTANGLTFVGGVYSTSLATSQAIAGKVLAAWSSAAAATSVAPSAPLAGAWSLAADCSAASVADTDGASWTLAVSPNHGASSPPAVVSGIIGGKLSLDCDATSANPPTGVPGTLTYSVYGGGAWVLDEDVAQFGATEVTVPGFDHAAVLHSPDGQELDFLVLTRGPNLLAVSLGGADATSVYGVSKAVADALDADR